MTLKVTKSKKKILFFFKVSLTGDWWDRICLPAPRDRTHTLLVQGQLVTHCSGYFIKKKLFYIIFRHYNCLVWTLDHSVHPTKYLFRGTKSSVLQKCP